MEKPGAAMSRKKLTLDKIVAGLDYQPEGGDKNRVYAYPKACKSACQHCQIPIVPTRRTAQ